MAKIQRLLVVVMCLVFVMAQGIVFGQDAKLPEGAKVVWDLAKAYRETTPTRERICINGLWRFQEAKVKTDRVPAAGWGYLKVPNPMRPQTAWYQREITIPENWAGRRISIYTEYLNSYAAVYLDGKKLGEILFPWGEVDITSACRPGGKHVLSLYTAAIPLSEVVLAYGDTFTTGPKSVKGSVSRRGLCGDVYLVSTPAQARIADVKIDTSVRKWELTLGTALKDLKPEVRYTLRSQITDGGRRVEEFVSKPFRAADLKDGRFPFTSKWKPDKLWDVHTPGNMYHLQLSLLDAEGKVLDTYQTVRFGFREIWIDGRDFYLNGTRFHCFTRPFDNSHRSPVECTYEGARQTMLNDMSSGVNIVYTHNYGCLPGSHLSFGEILKASDDVGMLMVISQPQYGHYKWKASDADKTNGYARLAEFYVRMTQNHPSVVMYSMNHNAGGNKRLLRSQEIVKRLDPTRLVYHHGSGLGEVSTSNLYLNFVPIQERSDWFENWATEGVKPLFLCEYGVPWDVTWTMYRGWYKRKRAFGSAKLPWEFCNAEWNAQFLGDVAYQLADAEKRNLRWETKQWQAGKIWNRWNYPCPPTALRRYSAPHKEQVSAMYITDNWRAFRTWGVSTFNAWTYGNFWKLRAGADRGRKDVKVDWDKIQKPGYSPDSISSRKSSDFIPTAAGRAIIRNNMPLLAYIGGKPARFTTKDHNFLPGETFQKQLIIINNSRVTVTCDCSWSLAFPQPARGSRKVTIETGQQERIPLELAVPAGVTPGAYKLSATVKFSSGETQTDTFEINVLPPPVAVKASAKIALFDPKGETTKLLKDMGIKCDAVDSKADLAGYEMLIVGKKALTLEGPAPDIGRVRDGLKVILFEQTSQVLEKRFGFRVQEYGLRRVFARVSDHSLLAGLTTDNLHDWQGEATTMPPKLTNYKRYPRYGSTIQWCGIRVTRSWRRGCWGNVASVLIEKPVRGNFLPLVDGGFSLQYSPLMVYREGSGVVVFCQLDVTGRSETEPAAQRVVANILNYVSDYRAPLARKLLYVGEPGGQEHLKSAGYAPSTYEGGKLSQDQVLVVGPGGAGKLAPHADAVKDWLNAGGNLLAVGLGQNEANAFLPFAVTTKKAEHICAVFTPAGAKSLLAGMGPADVHNRDPRQINLVSGGATVVGNGVLATALEGRVVFCQLAPWQFDYKKYYNMKRTFRRTGFMVTRILGNMGVSGSTPVLARFSSPLKDDEAAGRWMTGLYLDQPTEFDDPYRFFNW